MQKRYKTGLSLLLSAVTISLHQESQSTDYYNRYTAGLACAALAFMSTTMLLKQKPQARNDISYISAQAMAQLTVAEQAHRKTMLVKAEQSYTYLLNRKKSLWAVNFFALLTGVYCAYRLWLKK